jgi:hypothetical protein
MGLSEVVAALPLFRMRGPFEELANVGVMFVVLQLLRMFTGLVPLAAIEFFCHKGAFTSDDKKKLASNLWYATYYSYMALWGTRLFLEDTGWAYDMDQVCSWQPVAQVFSTWRNLHIYHCVQVAFYLNYVFAMVVGIDVRRKDQWAFAAHHVITLLLILFSRNWGYMRIQLAILALHDLADPLVHFSKVVKLARPLWEVVPDLIMALFALVFYATRWFMFPFYLVASCRDSWLSEYPADWTRASPAIWWQASDAGLVVAGFHVSYYGLAMLLLYALYCLHLYWGGYIFNMAWKKLVLGQGKIDENSDDEGIATDHVTKKKVE